MKEEPSFRFVFSPAVRVVLPLLLIVAVLATACGPAAGPGTGPGDPPAGASGDEPATITFAIWEHERQTYEPLAEQFMQEHPGINVLLVPMEDLVQSQEGPTSPEAMVRQIVSGADTAAAVNITPEVLKSNLLMDLTPLMDADPDFNRDDFYTSVIASQTINGATKVLPGTVRLQVLAYNKELFEMANISFPEPDWNWNDLLGAAEQLASKRGDTIDTYGFFETSGGFLVFLAMLEAKDVDLLTTSAKDVQLDREEIVTTVERMRDYFEDGVLLAPSYRRVDLEEDRPPHPRELAAAGRVAIWDSELTLYDYEGEEGQGPRKMNLPFEVGKMPYPQFKHDIMSLMSGQGYIISSGTRHPEAAWQWIEFLSRASPEWQRFEGDISSVRSPSSFPARKSVAEKMGYWDDLDEETREAYQLALERSSPGPALEQTPDQIIFNVLMEVLMPIFSGQGGDADIEQALMDAQQQLEERVATRQLTPTPVPDDSPVVVATPEPQTAPEGSTPIAFMSMMGNPGEMRQRARTFREEHPDIFVDLKTTQTMTGPLEVGQRQLARMYDCVLYNGAPPTEQADTSTLLDLQPLFDADATFSQDEYPPALLEAIRRDGHLIGVPFGFMMRTLTYNKTAFDAAGIAPPSAQWTPDDFLAAALALTAGEGDDKQYGYVPLGGQPIEDMRFFIHQFGGNLLLGSGESLRPNFDDPKVVQALRWYIDLAEVHQVMPPISISYKPNSPEPTVNAYELIQNGQAGMWFDFGYGMFSYPADIPPDARPPQEFEVAIAPLPIGNAGLSGNDLHISGMFHISAQTENPQACWEWFKFLADDPTLVQWVIPARLSLARSEAYLAQAQPRAAELVETYADLLETPGSVASIGGAQQGHIEMYWLFEAIMQTVEEGADLEAALVEAQETTSAFLDCVANNDDRPECARSVDPDYEGYMMKQE
jgi:ABC-type glycerol-3-phosphate transport system substrate-binding protein